IKQNKPEEAEKFYLEELVMRRNLGGTESAEAAGCLLNLGKVYKKQGRLPEAKTLLHEALIIQRTLSTNYALQVTILNLADVLEAQGDYGKAEELLLDGYQLFQQRKQWLPEHTREFI